MATMKSITGSLAVVALTFSVYAQLTQPNASEWSPTSKRAAEDAVANKVAEIRASAKRPPLERVSPSVGEVELVCTTALTGRKVGDPIFGGLETYVTNDISAETEVLKRTTLLPKKDWPRYSVIVERNPNSTPENTAYTVGVARRPSALAEFFAPLFFDVPFEGINKWKKEVAPQCRNRKG
ncbi:MAG: hypothetical protein WAN13_12145 [Candidatus Acidiferrales bacterium]|jgi:hypothetical protein